MTKKYSIIGKPLSHSLSPILHNYWFKKYKIDAEYTSLEVNENDIKSVIELIKKKKLNGINITLPYKQKIIPYLDNIVNDAKESHSVNTVYLSSENKTIGENTDVFGLQAGYLKEIIDNKNRKQKTLIIGAGGVAPSIILSLQKSQINDITLTNRTIEKARFLKRKFNNIDIIEWDLHLDKIQDFDIIINATSLGMKNAQDFDFFYENIKPELIYIDTIYNPSQTKMIKHFKKKNIKTFNGLDMFIYQGQKSFYIWNKINPEIDENLINLLKKNIK